MYCFDTDVVSAVMLPRPPLHLVRRLARIPAGEQCTTAVTLGELVYGAARSARTELAEQVLDLTRSSLRIVPFDTAAAKFYGPLRAELERRGRRLEEPDLRIASIALAGDLTLVTGNVRHFSRVPGLRVENWLAAE